MAYLCTETGFSFALLFLLIFVATLTNTSAPTGTESLETLTLCVLISLFSLLLLFHLLGVISARLQLTSLVLSLSSRRLLVDDQSSVCLSVSLRAVSFPAPFTVPLVWFARTFAGESHDHGELSEQKERNADPREGRCERSARDAFVRTTARNFSWKIKASYCCEALYRRHFVLYFFCTVQGGKVVKLVQCNHVSAACCEDVSETSRVDWSPLLVADSNFNEHRRNSGRIHSTIFWI